MSFSDLAALGSFISGVAVLASLIFVGFQLKQNTQAVRAEASQAHAANYFDIVGRISVNSDLARIFRMGLQDAYSLTDDERTRFIALVGGVFRFYEAARVQWTHGQLDKEHWQTVERNIVRLLGIPGVVTYWMMRRSWHSDEFQTWYESLPPQMNSGSIYELPPRNL